MRQHEVFDWDLAKARSNFRKHRVSFEDAAAMLADEMSQSFHIEDYDEPHSDEEERYITTGTDPQNRSVVLRAVWTVRNGQTRIISARLATRMERNIYETQIKIRHDHS
jgi:uncharacterized DUF497 family protein